MKKIILSTLCFLSITLIIAQTPQAFQYQAVARDAAGNVLSDELVSLKISILESSAVGTSVYSEEHTALTTNQYGLVSLAVGSGSVLSGVFQDIDWGGNTHFLKIEMDESGGANYELMGTSQLLSVPYALYSGNTANPDDHDWSVEVDSIYSLPDQRVGIGTSSPQAMLDVAGHISTSNTGGSVFIGNNAGINDNLTDNNNIFIGDESGSTNLAGEANTAIGTKSLKTTISGDANTAIGYGALEYSTGDLNVAVGSETLKNTTSADFNTALGANASLFNTTGFQNTAVGAGALYFNQTGDYNTAIGTVAGHGISGSSIDSCVFIGYGAGYYETESNKLYIENSDSDTPLIYGEFDNGILGVNGNLGIGTQNPSASLEVVGHISQTGIGKCVFLGDGAGNSYSTGDKYNTFIGYRAGYDNSVGHSNTSIGSLAFYNNTDGQQNTAVGRNALYDNTEGHHNVAMGAYSLENNISGTSNLAIGSFAQSNLTTGDGNTALGFNALHANSTGNYNIAIGANAGPYSAPTNINHCIFIGQMSGYFETEDDRLYIENSSSTKPLIYGEFDNNILGVNGILGVGTSSPNANLEVYNADGQTDIRITKLSSSYSSTINFYTGLTQVWNILNPSGNKNLVIDRGTGNTTGDLILLSDGGRVGIGTTIPQARFQIFNGTDASLSEGGYLITGSTVSHNIVIDENEIMARNNGATNTLHLQREGGSLALHYDQPELDQVYINSSGWTGIGENSPNSKLHVNTYTGENGLRVQINTATKFLVHSNGGVVAGHNVTTPTFAFQLQNSNIDLLGRGRAYSWNTYSDNRLKSNQRPIEYGLDEVMQLNPKNYDHHSSSTNEEGEFIMVTNQKVSTIGFIAQEVQQVIPEAVCEPADDSKDLWTMDYERLIPVLTKAIQEQQMQIEKMEKEIAILKSKLN